jgi:hypothetical protein
VDEQGAAWGLQFSGAAEGLAGHQPQQGLPTPLDDLAGRPETLLVLKAMPSDLTLFHSLLQTGQLSHSLGQFHRAVEYREEVLRNGRELAASLTPHICVDVDISDPLASARSMLTVLFEVAEQEGGPGAFPLTLYVTMGGEKTAFRRNAHVQFLQTLWPPERGNVTAFSLHEWVSRREYLRFHTMTSIDEVVCSSAKVVVGRRGLPFMDLMCQKVACRFF